MVQLIEFWSPSRSLEAVSAPSDPAIIVQARNNEAAKADNPTVGSEAKTITGGRPIAILRLPMMFQAPAATGLPMVALQFTDHDRRIDAIGPAPRKFPQSDVESAQPETE